MNKLCLFVYMVLCLFSCSDMEHAELSSLVPFSVKGSVSGVSLTRSDNALVSSTAGLYILRTDTTPSITLSTTSYKNIKYTVDGSGTFSSSDSVLLSNTHSYSALSYSPYGLINNPDSVVYSGGVDVLYAPKVSVSVTQTTASATLQYQHLMSRITFNLVSGTNSPDLTDALLSVSGFYSSCRVSLVDGSLSPIMGSGSVITDINTPHYIIPGPLNLSITVTIGERTYTGTAVFTAVSSTDYSYTITVNKESVGISCSVVGWNSVNGGDL